MPVTLHVGARPRWDTAELYQWLKDNPVTTSPGKSNHTCERVYDD